MPKKFIFLHEKRAKIDSERIYGNPSVARDRKLKRRSKFLGWLFNLKINRPNKGKIIKTNETLRIENFKK